MRKAIPIVYILLLYFLIAILFYFQTDIKIGLVFIAIVIFGISNVINAIGLYKEKKEKELKFSMCLTAFGSFPFLVAVFLFFSIIAILASDYQHGLLQTYAIAAAFNGFVRISCAFYGYFYAKLRELAKIHRILQFVPLLNVIDVIVVLIEERKRI